MAIKQPHSMTSATARRMKPMARSSSPVLVNTNLPDADGQDQVVLC